MWQYDYRKIGLKVFNYLAMVIEQAYSNLTLYWRKTVGAELNTGSATNIQCIVFIFVVSQCASALRLIRKTCIYHLERCFQS